MMHSEDIPLQQLVDWVEGRLPAAEADRIAEQLATASESTRAAAAWLQAFYQVSRELVLAPPPDSVRHYLAQQFEAYSQQRQPPGFFQRLVATLAFDSDSQLAVAGARSAAMPESERQLVYATSAADVVLDVHAGAPGEPLHLAGQVFPIGDSPVAAFYSVQLLQDTAEQAITATDDLGEFAFPAIAPGTYDLVLSSDHFEVVIPAVELHSQ